MKGKILLCTSLAFLAASCAFIAADFLTRFGNTHSSDAVKNMSGIEYVDQGELPNKDVAGVTVFPFDSNNRRFL